MRCKYVKEKLKVWMEKKDAHHPIVDLEYSIKSIIFVGLNQTMKKLYLKIRRYFKKIYVQGLRYYRPKMESRYEIIAFKICMNLIDDESSELLMTPITNKRYIKNESKNLFVTIDSVNVNIVNDHCAYTVFMNEFLHGKLVDRFNEKIELKRSMMEKKITQNIKYSLRGILHFLES
jgi:hypothetical protein